MGRLLLIGICAGAMLFYLNTNAYEVDYFGVLGLSKTMTYQKLVKTLGEPLKKQSATIILMINPARIC